MSPLSVETVRIPARTVHDLRTLGIRRIGQLLQLPRAELPLRFGENLVVRLEQLLGERPEPLVGLPLEVPVTAAMAFEFAIENPQPLLAALEQLCGQVCRDLLRRGRGARVAEMRFVSDPAQRRPETIREIRFARPVRDPARMLKLLACKFEQVDAAGGFVAVRLTIPAHDSVAPAQAPLAAARPGEDASDPALEMDRLVERLVVRLGESAVIRPVPVESYLPERAWRATHAVDPPEAIEGPAKQATVGREAASLTAGPTGVRPLRLLTRPVEIGVVAEPFDRWDGRPVQFKYGPQIWPLVHVVGPERLAGEWWRGHDKTRDYYDVQTPQGRRFWLFRVGTNASNRWFLHGIFE